MRKNLAAAIAFPIFIALLCLGLCAASFTSSGPIIIGRVPDSAETVREFFNEMKAENYSKAMEYVSSHDSIGLETQSGELLELYKQRLAESYSIEFCESSMPDDGNRLTDVQSVLLTFLDSRLLFAAASEKAGSDALEYIYDGSVIESDEQAMQFFYDALAECLARPEGFYTSEVVDIHLSYNGSCWKIEMDDALIDVLYGYIGSAYTEESK